MLKKILIIVFGLIFALGVVFAFTGRPDVDVGIVSVENAEESAKAKAYHVSSRYKNDIEEHKTEAISDIIEDIPRLVQEVDRNTPTGEEILGDIKVSYNGKYYGDIYYTVYDEDGEVLVERSKSLNIPTGDIDSCVVKVNVFWGNEKNYEEYDYYFAVDYKYV